MKEPLSPIVPATHPAKLTDEQVSDLADQILDQWERDIANRPGPPSTATITTP